MCSESNLNPRTFQVYFRDPFGFQTSQIYYFYLHANSHEDALEWVERVFDGIETDSLRSSWLKENKKVSTVGIRTTVSIVDVDRMKDGKDGKWRRTTKEVVKGLKDMFDKLEKEYKFLVKSYKPSVDQYNKTPTEYYFARLEQIIQHVSNIKRWKCRLFDVIESIPDEQLVLPERKHLTGTK